MDIRKKKLRDKVCKIAEKVVEEFGSPLSFRDLCYYSSLEGNFSLTYKQFAQYFRGCKNLERIVVDGNSYYIFKNQKDTKDNR